MKWAVVLDTNRIYTNKPSQDMSKWNLDKYNEIQKVIEDNSLGNEIKIFFPELVLLELKKHYRDDLNLKIKKIKELKNEFKNFKEIDIELKAVDIDQHCDNLFDYYRQNLNTIPIPTEFTDLFNSILEMAVNKYPPFKKGDSDHGFKDAIIYKSIQKFSENGEYDKFVLVTGDTGFLNQAKILKKNFYRNTSSQLDIINKNEINSYLVNEFGLYGDLNKYINGDFYDDLIDRFFICSMIEINSVLYWIKDWDFKKELTKINKLNENEFEVAIFISIDIDCRDDENWQPVLGNPIKKTVTQQENYKIYLEDGKWKKNQIYGKYLFF